MGFRTVNGFQTRTSIAQARKGLAHGDGWLEARLGNAVELAREVGRLRDDLVAKCPGWRLRGLAPGRLFPSNASVQKIAVVRLAASII